MTLAQLLDGSTASNVPGVASLSAAVGSALLSVLKRFLSLGDSNISSLFEDLLFRELVEAWLIEETARGRSGRCDECTGCGETGGDRVAIVTVLCDDGARNEGDRYRKGAAEIWKVRRRSCCYEEWCARDTERMLQERSSTSGVAGNAGERMAGSDSFALDLWRVGSSTGAQTVRFLDVGQC